MVTKELGKYRKAQRKKIKATGNPSTEIITPCILGPFLLCVSLHLEGNISSHNKKTVLHMLLFITCFFHLITEHFSVPLNMLVWPHFRSAGLQTPGFLP